MAQGKKYRDALKRFDREHLHTPAEAVDIVGSLAKANFDETVELVVRLGVDPRKADQIVRGTVALPSGTGKDVRVAVFAQGDAAAAAREAGADIVGADDLAAEIEGGMLDFDVAIATPDLMPVVGRLGRVLGPRGLMPNPKTGTVTPDVAKAVERVQGRQGRVPHRPLRQRARPDRQGVVRAGRAARQLPGRRRRAQPGQAGVGQGPLRPPGHRQHRRWAPASRSTPPGSGRASTSRPPDQGAGPGEPIGFPPASNNQLRSPKTSGAPSRA